MGETDKPFACPLSECGMKFTNEDHLTVHKRKHDMCLSFGNGQKMNVFVADQTPTPTRFIRNCEEVGLFQDLQNVNPFEEQFRKAAEAVKSGSTSLHPEVEPMCGHADDTLHTPQVFPQIEHLPIPVTRVPDSPPVPVAVITSQHSISHSNETRPDKVPFALHTETSTTSDETNSPPTKDTTVQVLLRLPDGKVVKLNAVEMAESEGTSAANIHSSNILTTPSVIVDHPPSSGQPSRTVLLHSTSRPSSQQVPANNSKPMLSNNNTDKMAIAKQKLKQTLTSNQRVAAANKVQQPNVNMNNKVAIPSIKDSRALQAAAASSMSSTDAAVVPVASQQGAKRTRESSGSSGNSGDDSQKRQKFLERNRAAASRCRQKRKNWVSMLQHRADVVHATNQQLVAEVSTLKEQVAQLQTLLLAHRDCSVTKAMCQAGVIRLIESNEELSEVTEVTTQVHVKPIVSPPLDVPTGVIRVVRASTSRSTDVARKEEVPSVQLQSLAVPEPSHIMCLPSKSDGERNTFMLTPLITNPPQPQRDLLVLKKVSTEKETVIVRNKI